MGRAIEMENDIEALRVKLFKLENIVRGMPHAIADLEDEVDIILDENHPAYESWMDSVILN